MGRVQNRMNFKAQACHFKGIPARICSSGGRPRTPVGCLLAVQNPQGSVYSLLL